MNVIKKPDGKNPIIDRDSIFRWNRITRCRRDVNLQSQHSIENAKQKYLKNCVSCPQCGKPVEQLSWVYIFDTENRNPRQGGWVTVCDMDQKEVSFFVEQQEFFPWEIVDAAKNNEIFQIRFISMFGNPSGRLSCPVCNQPPERLLWLGVRSSDESWDSLAGIEGWLSICEVCHLQVELKATGFS